MKQKTKEKIDGIITCLFEMFVNIWFIIWVFWTSLVIGVTNASKVIVLEYWIIAELLVMIGFMISTKLWLDSF